MNDLLMCLGAVLIPVLIVAGLWSKKKFKPHKEYVDTPYVHPIESYSMTRPRS